MITLVTALYAEGRTDERFLPVIIQRTLAQLLGQYGRDVTEVWEPMLVEPSKKLPTRVENILAVARQTHGYHILMVHADSDSSEPKQAFQQRFEPGLRLVNQASIRGEKVCAELIPIIPVQMTEAWMLADTNVLIDVIGTQLRAEALGVPLYAHQIEAISDAKQRLEEILQVALAEHPRRKRRQRSIKELYEPLGRQIRLNRLLELPSYQRFIKDVTDTLSRLNLIVVI